jgi:hypothetical protein
MGILIQVVVGAILTDKEATNLVALVSINEHSIMEDNVLKINQHLRGRKVKTVIEVGVVKVTVLLEGVREDQIITVDTTEGSKFSTKEKTINTIITTIKVPKVSGAEEGNSLTIRASINKNTKMIGKTISFLSSNMMKTARKSILIQRFRNQKKNRIQRSKMSSK